MHLSSFSQGKSRAYSGHVAVVYRYQLLVAALLVCIPSGYCFIRASERIDGMDREKCSSLVLLLVVLCRVGNLGALPLDRSVLAVVEEESPYAQGIHVCCFMDRGYLGHALLFSGEKNSLSLAVINPGSNGRGALYRLHIHGGEGENAYRG